MARRFSREKAPAAPEPQPGIPILTTTTIFLRVATEAVRSQSERRFRFLDNYFRRLPADLAHWMNEVRTMAEELVRLKREAPNRTAGGSVLSQVASQTIEARLLPMLSVRSFSSDYLGDPEVVRELEAALAELGAAVRELRESEPLKRRPPTKWTARQLCALLGALHSDLQLICGETPGEPDVQHSKALAEELPEPTRASALRLRNTVYLLGASMGGAASSADVSGQCEALEGCFGALGGLLDTFEADDEYRDQLAAALEALRRLVEAQVMAQVARRDLRKAVAAGSLQALKACLVAIGSCAGVPVAEVENARSVVGLLESIPSCTQGLSGAVEKGDAVLLNLMLAEARDVIEGLDAAGCASPLLQQLRDAAAAARDRSANVLRNHDIRARLQTAVEARDAAQLSEGLGRAAALEGELGDSGLLHRANALLSELVAAGALEAAVEALREMVGEPGHAAEVAAALARLPPPPAPEVPPLLRLRAQLYPEVEAVDPRLVAMAHEEVAAVFGSAGEDAAAVEARVRAVLATLGDAVQLKCLFDGETRMLTVPRAWRLEEVSSRLSAKLGVPRPLQLRWRDSDSDYISVSSEEDWTEALAQATRGRLVLEVGGPTARPAWRPPAPVAAQPVHGPAGLPVPAPAPAVLAAQAAAQRRRFSGALHPPSAHSNMDMMMRGKALQL